MSKRILVLPDIHFPVHDAEALEVVIAAVDYWDPHEIVQLGDMLDCADASTHGRKLLTEERGTYLDGEVAPAVEFLDRIQGRRERRQMVLIEGNHEYRIQRMCLDLAMGADVYKMLAPEHLLTQRRNVEWLPYMDAGTGFQRYMIAPNLAAAHGWSHAKKAADQHMQKARYQYSVVFGHVHRGCSSDPVMLDSGEYVYSWSPGMLCDRRPLYLHDKGPNAWHTGFSMIYQSEDDPRDWTPYTVTIAKGRCVLPCGKEIRV